MWRYQSMKQDWKLQFKMTSRSPRGQWVQLIFSSGLTKQHRCYKAHVADLTHWGRVTHICVSKITIIGSDNGLSPGRRQAIIWTNVRILLIWNLGTNFNEIFSEIHTFSFKKMLFKMSSAQWRLFRLGVNVLMQTRHNSIANALQLCLFCNKSLIFSCHCQQVICK